jgi:F0F1-type ATP synthase delta subunit
LLRNKEILQKVVNQKEISIFLNSMISLDQSDLAFFALLEKQKKILQLPHICLQIAKKAASLNGQTLCTAFSSKLLSTNEKQLVINFLSQQNLPNPLVMFAEDTTLISGIRVEADCFLYEKSIKSRINHTLLTLKMMAQ